MKNKKKLKKKNKLIQNTLKDEKRKENKEIKSDFI
jgi:hypothetical protein